MKDYLMKKIFLLFTIICASQLYGMEPEWSLQKVAHMSQLPKDIQQKIINKSLELSDNVGQALGMIAKLSILQGIEYNTLPIFNVLMDKLANKFFEYSRQSIARNFGIEIGKEYVTLNEKFYAMAKNFEDKPTLEKYKDFIAQGADSNFTFFSGGCYSFFVHIWHDSFDGILPKVCEFVYSKKTDTQEALKILEYLLQQGSNPNVYVDITKFKSTTLLQKIIDTLQRMNDDPVYASAVFDTCKLDKVIKMLERYGAK